MKTLTTLAALAVTAPLAQAATVPLASTMDPTSYFSENAATGAFARINEGNGSLGSVGANTGDADGVYNIANLNSPSAGSPMGTPIDFFPREANFVVGSLSYDESAITGVGVETTAITSIDLSGFWTADPNRTSVTPGSAPTVISDLSDHAIGLWFFNASGAISFGAIDAADTVTFTNGLLTSIDLEIATSFTVDLIPESFDGVFSIAGKQLSYQINDTGETFVGPSTIVADLTGVVNAVVPEPSCALMACVSLLGAGVWRRR